MIRSDASGLKGLIEMPDFGASCFGWNRPSVAISSSAASLPGLELDARVEVFGVLADDDDVDRLVA